MSIETDRIAQLEAELAGIRWQLKLAGDSDHAQREHIASFERRIAHLTTLFQGERTANAALKDGIASALQRLRAIEAAYDAEDAALFGP